MQTDLIVESHVTRHAFARGPDGLLGLEIHLLIFEAPPQPFDEDVVPAPPDPIHADLNSMRLQKPREFLTGELALRRELTQINAVFDGVAARRAEKCSDVLGILRHC